MTPLSTMSAIKKTLFLACLAVIFVVFFWITAVTMANRQCSGTSPLPGGLMLIAFPFVAVYFLVSLFKLVPLAQNTEKLYQAL